MFPHVQQNPENFLYGEKFHDLFPLLNETYWKSGPKEKNDAYDIKQNLFQVCW